MNKVAVIYYSLEGHTQFVAEKISERLGCPVIRIRLKKEFSTVNTFFKFFWAGKSSVFRETPALADQSLDLEAYATIILATPVWAGNLSSPVRSFLSKHRLEKKRVFLVATNSGGSSERCFATMITQLPTGSVSREIGFINISEETYPIHRKQLEDFCDDITT